MRRILSLTFAAGLVALLAACSTLESTLSQEVGSGTSTPGAKAPRLGPGMWPMPKVLAANSHQPAPSLPPSSAGR
jgi:hypothetical protein